MPDTLLGSGSVFDRTKSTLAQWLRNNLENVHSLPTAAMDDYDPHFVAGWSAKIEHQKETLLLHVLLNGQFPYTPIRIALKSKDVYLKWPHVERGGLLCLPRLPAPATNPDAVIRTTIADALLLVEKCADPNFVMGELRREFVSYWNRSEHDKVKSVFSLLNLSDQRARHTAVWFGRSFTLIGETPDQVGSWFKNHFGAAAPPTITAGVFGFLDQAPTPPFPERPGELFALLAANSAETLVLFDDLPIEERIGVVLGAETPTGIGLIGMRIEPPSLNGFRKGAVMNAAIKATLWKSRGQLKRSTVERFDPAWVHGRGQNKEQPLLERSSVLLLGCGSLGSQVAVRLAQSGVGAIRLVDPDVLASANVGRHALGTEAVGQYKARALATKLQRQFPHMRLADGYNGTWQEILVKRPEIFAEATLIVACLGEWGADGQLGEWQMKGARLIVYGWLDEHGVAAHALALQGQKPALICILNEDGSLRTPETLWEGNGLVQAEPACGTLFQPYGAIDVAEAEVLVSRLCIDVLTGRAKAPLHRLRAGTTAQITEAGGEWSPMHMSNRPTDFAGSFDYERAIKPCGACTTCVEAA